MPELPEVETIRRKLVHGDVSIPSIIGAEIINAEVFWEGSVAEPNIEEFLFIISNTIIKDINRRGKYFLFAISDRFLVMHLRMSGDLNLTPVNEAAPKYSRVIFTLNNGYHLNFIDSRKFGRVWVVTDPE